MDKEGPLIDQDASLEEGELSDSLGDESQEAGATKADHPPQAESDQKEKRSTKKKAEDKKSKVKVNSRFSLVTEASLLFIFVLKFILIYCV